MPGMPLTTWPTNSTTKHQYLPPIVRLGLVNHSKTDSSGSLSSQAHCILSVLLLVNLLLHLCVCVFTCFCVCVFMSVYIFSCLFASILTRIYDPNDSFPCLSGGVLPMYLAPGVLLTPPQLLSNTALEFGDLIIVSIFLFKLPDTE